LPPICNAKLMEYSLHLAKSGAPYVSTSDTLEKAVVEAFKMGFEVLEAEETEDEDGNKLLCCDATMQSTLDAETIDAQVEKLVHLAEKYDIIYDGWGTYYEGEDALYQDDDEDEDFED